MRVPMQTISRKTLTKKKLFWEINKKWFNDLAQKAKRNVSSLTKQLEYFCQFFFSNTWRKCIKERAIGDCKWNVFSIWPPVPTTWLKIQLQNCPSTLLIWMQTPTFSGKDGNFSQPGYFGDDVTSSWKVGAETSKFSSPKRELIWDVFDFFDILW